MAFTQKLLTFQFSLATGNFEGGGNTASASGLWASTTIEIVGNEGGSSMSNCAIYGLPLSMMNQLSTVGTQVNQRTNNTVTVSAGDAETGMSVVYTGKIFTAFVDAQAMPRACFRMTGNVGGGYWGSKQVPPISKSGSQDVASMMQTLAGQMGMQFENNGVNVKLSNPYYPGTPWNQAWRIAKHANVDMVVDRGTMAICPAGKPRAGAATLISSETGMVGYPAFRDAAIIVKALFNPTVKPNGTIQVQSTITPACGMWKVNKIVYELESVPHGRWFMTMEAVPPTDDHTPS